uniref:Uncharacterized protein n=1 Tax=Oryza sativa subsp. japonica TaxID=39947 RepID=Q6K737_ORYSJ|nr:hypothetical protein [Oryza sativa Japonica Group]
MPNRPPPSSSTLSMAPRHSTPHPSKSGRSSCSPSPPPPPHSPSPHYGKGPSPFFPFFFPFPTTTGVTASAPLDRPRQLALLDRASPRSRGSISTARSTAFAAQHIHTVAAFAPPTKPPLPPAEHLTAKSSHPPRHCRRTTVAALLLLVPLSPLPSVAEHRRSWCVRGRVTRSSGHHLSLPSSLAAPSRCRAASASRPPRRDTDRAANAASSSLPPPFPFAPALCRPFRRRTAPPQVKTRRPLGPEPLRLASHSRTGSAKPHPALPPPSSRSTASNIRRASPPPPAAFAPSPSDPSRGMGSLPPPLPVGASRPLRLAAVRRRLSAAVSRPISGELPLSLSPVPASVAYTWTPPQPPALA